MVRVAMEHHIHGIPAERLLQPAGAEIRIDLEGLTSDRCRNRGVVQ
jgi:hypothetical protein